jgi:chromosome segregation ATPase
MGWVSVVVAFLLGMLTDILLVKGHARTIAAVERERDAVKAKLKYLESEHVKAMKVADATYARLTSEIEAANAKLAEAESEIERLNAMCKDWDDSYTGTMQSLVEARKRLQDIHELAEPFAPTIVSCETADFNRRILNERFYNSPKADPT